MPQATTHEWFVDTSAWASLVDQDQADHAATVTLFAEAFERRHRLFTTPNRPSRT